MINDRVPIIRDFNINFPIEEVKKSIQAVCELSRTSYKIESKNDIFNTYTLILIGGITACHPNIQLKKISENETNLVLTDNIREGNTIASNEVIDKFLSLLGRSLSGEQLTKDVIAKDKAGCFTLLIGLVGLGSGLYYLLG